MCSLAAVNPSLVVVQYFRGELKREQTGVARGTSAALVGNLALCKGSLCQVWPCCGNSKVVGGRRKLELLENSSFIATSFFLFVSLVVEPQLFLAFPISSLLAPQPRRERAGWTNGMKVGG